MNKFLNVITKTKIETQAKIETKIKNKKINNKVIKMFTSLSLILLFVLNILMSNSYAEINKANYADWIRELYDYDDTVSDEEILKEKGFEDETGRVFFKNPNTLQYELYTGESEVIAYITGMPVGNNTNVRNINIDLSNLTFNSNVTNIVEYYQTDYPNVMYGRTGTIKTSGCGPTSLAMVVDSLTNANIGVVGMCNWAVANGYRCEGNGTYQSMMSTGARAFGLTVREIAKSDAQGLADALASGHPVIALMGPGHFTSGGHYIVLTGIDQNGYVSVNDPNSRTNTSKKWSIQTIVNESRRGYWEYSTPNMN